MLFSIARLIFAVFLVTPLLFAWAGGLRFYLGLKPELALLSAFPVFILFVYLDSAKLAFKTVQQLLLCSAVFLYFACRLYNPALGLLVSYGCADSANHLALYRDFIAGNQYAYNGFNALYMNWWFVERFSGASTLTALSLALASPLFAVSYMIAFFAPAVILKGRNLLRFAGFAAALIVIAETSLLPLMHYNQADGYLAHLYSVSVYIAAIFFGESLGYFSLAALIVASRFTYSLQLPDLLAAASIFFAIKSARAAEKIRRIIYACSALILLISVSAGLKKLSEAFSLAGSIVSQNLDSAFAAQIAGLALLVSCRRKNSLEIWFLVTISLIQGFWLFTTSESDYYFSKLFLYSSVGLSLIALRELPNLLESKVILRGISWIMLVTFLVTAQRPYIPSYLERAMPDSNYRLIAPLIDVKVKEIIDEVLINEKKAFARYVTSRWAQYSLFNFMYGADGNFSAFTSPPSALEANSCIFWSSNANDIPRFEKYPAPEAVSWLNSMNSRSDAKVVKYQAEWAGRQVLRYLCSSEQQVILK